jgi:hypothetical protein
LHFRREEVLMTLFTKKGCKKCSYIKKQIPALLNIKIYDVQTAEGLAELAYLELVPIAEKALPILIHEDRVITGAINIKREIRRHS